ncbi:MAG: hypothetical protein IKD78_12275, partial [Bacteroidales bacterium]|nr:hypothetical protein [Bacteroidales bacterium]
MTNGKTQEFKATGVILHVTIWTALFLLPITLVGNGEHMSLKRYLITCVWPLLWAIVFYLNYFWNAPYNYLRN